MKLWITLAVVGIFVMASLMPGCQSKTADKKVESKPTSYISPIRSQASKECFAAAIPFELESVIEPIEQLGAPSAIPAHSADLLAMGSAWQPMSAETSLYNVQSAEIMVSSDLLREPEKTVTQPVIPEFPTVRTDTLLPNVSVLPASTAIDGPELDQSAFMLRKPEELVSVFEAEIMVTSMLQADKAYSRTADFKDDNNLASIQIPEIGFLDDAMRPQF